ncbi:hypothetical protein ACQ856_24175 [Mycolicibacterium psychrotolerans]|uniref:hypothetical protein n=1 Tax=Mycolicibacterium psychrotolerans TaxID=216929 RepID=UPI003D66C54B
MPEPDLVAEAGGEDEAVDCRPPLARAGPALAVAFDVAPVESLFDDVEPCEAPVPPASADAAGIVAMAAPTPRATADAPTHVSIRRWPWAPGLAAARPPNSAGSIRNWPATGTIVWSAELIEATPRRP